MARKRLTADSVSNPLEESAFFPRPQPEPQVEIEPERPEEPPPTQPRKKTEKSSTAQNKAETDEPKRKRGRPQSKRKTTRYSFEFYDDQLERLVQVRAHRMIATRKNIPMSVIVREAIDDYLRKHERKIKAN